MRDMLDWAQPAQRFVADVSQDQFLHDELAQSAVISCVDRLAHDYSGIDIDEVWRSVSIDVPTLVTALEAALAR
jgi:uncharacterized protein with HEPN domain